MLDYLYKLRIFGIAASGYHHLCYITFVTL